MAAVNNLNSLRWVRPLFRSGEAASTGTTEQGGRAAALTAAVASVAVELGAGIVPAGVSS